MKLSNIVFYMLTTFALAMTASNASAAVLVFDNLAIIQHAEELQGIGNEIDDKGYHLAYAAAPDEEYPVGFHAVGQKWPYNGKSIAVLANNCSANTTLTRHDNSVFSVKSIDLAAVNDDQSYYVSFIGITTEGTTTHLDVYLDNGAKWKRIVFPATFRNLKSLSWMQGDCTENPPHMFDNIFLSH
ncbi:MAG: hypothetical protein IPG66_08045 [Hydrogenophilales bacterium]|nr:hypothetical protein [Hydrogenophilales bacterium]